MTRPWEIRIYERQQLLYSGRFVGAVELGRQSEGEGGPFTLRIDSGGNSRVVIAKAAEDTISRRHALIEATPDGRVRVKNLSQSQLIRFPDNTRLQPGVCCDLPSPALLLIGGKTIRVQESVPSTVQLQEMDHATRPPGNQESTRFPAQALAGSSPIQLEELVRWFQGAMTVLQSAAGSSDFFQKAARAVVDMVGLDSSRVLLWDGAQWKSHAVQVAPHMALRTAWDPSHRVLDKVRLEKKTCWQLPKVNEEDNDSLAGVMAVVAAPILNPQGDVIGALYGDRLADSPSQTPAHVTKLEAMLVELLASSVAAGLARREQEQAALSARVRFEEFFSPELAYQLETNPDLLKGRDSEVSVLFCDIRGFSRISERLGPAGTLDWIGDVLDTLSNSVRKEHGVLVDYIGDELMAMWGAPEIQPDHAERACRAALDMLEQLPKLNARWLPTLQEPTSIGIGINTGVARVGNTGSKHKFKYGPLGNTVNLASRVQGATKYLKTRLLITGFTREKLGPDFKVRRLCPVRVVNIEKPVDLYEVFSGNLPGQVALKEGYELALEYFERKDFRGAARILGNLIAEHRDDGPSLVLLSRVLPCHIEEPKNFDPTWVLPGK